MDKKKGQIWVETVIYTLIGLGIIGIMLAVIQPKISAQKDKLIIEQTIEIMKNEIDTRMDISPGNVRQLDLKLSKGNLFIDGENDKIYWILEESKYKFSEVGDEIELGRVKVKTEGEEPWKITLKLDYLGLDLKYDGKDFIKEIEATASLYIITFENLGISESGPKQIINIRVV